MPNRESKPVPAKMEVPHITPALKLLSLIQPTVLLSVAVLVGTVLAPKVGLSSPVAEAVAGNGQPLRPVLKPQIIPAAIGGLACGFAIILIWVFIEAASAAGLCGAKRRIKQTDSASNSLTLRRHYGRTITALGIDDAADLGGVAII